MSIFRVKLFLYDSIVKNRNYTRNTKNLLKFWTLNSSSQKILLRINNLLYSLHIICTYIQIFIKNQPKFLNWLIKFSHKIIDHERFLQFCKLGRISERLTRNLEIYFQWNQEVKFARKVIHESPLPLFTIFRFDFKRSPNTKNHRLPARYKNLYLRIKCDQRTGMRFPHQTFPIPGVVQEPTRQVA